MSSPSPALVNQLRNQRQPSTTDSSSRNMAEHSRPNSRYSESKYTDPTRTSSSSFKPPMTKEAVSKSKTQQPKSDSGLFSALSYIKHMIVGKPTGDNSMKTLASDSQKNKTPTKENKPESKSEKPKEIEANQKAEEQTDFLPTDARSWGQLSPALTGMKSTDKISKKDKIMKPNKRPQSKREVVPLENDAPKFDLPHYTPVRFVENRSTYLHAPEKKGTTSFRITTCPKSNHIPMPTLLSPNMEHSRSPGRKSGNTKNKDMRYSRKQSTSPIRHEKESYQSRVRSKSTLDSPSPKARSVSLSDNSNCAATIRNASPVAFVIQSKYPDSSAANVKTSSNASIRIKPSKVTRENIHNKQKKDAKYHHQSSASDKDFVSSKSTTSTKSSPQLSRARKVKPDVSISVKSLHSSKSSPVGNTQSGSKSATSLKSGRHSQQINIGPTVLKPTITVTNDMKSNKETKDRSPIPQRQAVYRGKPIMPSDFGPPETKQPYTFGKTDHADTDAMHINSPITTPCSTFEEEQCGHTILAMSNTCQNKNDINQLEPRLNSLSVQVGLPSKEPTNSPTVKERYYGRNVNHCLSNNGIIPENGFESNFSAKHIEPQRTIGAAVTQNYSKTYPSARSLLKLTMKGDGSASRMFPSVELMNSSFNESNVKFQPTVINSTTAHSGYPLQDSFRVDEFNNRSNSASSQSFDGSDVLWNPMDYRIDILKGDIDTERDMCNSALPGKLTCPSNTVIPPSCLLSEDSESEVYEVALGPSLIIEKKTNKTVHDSIVDNYFQDEVEPFPLQPAQRGKYDSKMFSSNAESSYDSANEFQHLTKRLDKHTSPPVEPTAYRQRRHNRESNKKSTKSEVTFDEQMPPTHNAIRTSPTSFISSLSKSNSPSRTSNSFEGKPNQIMLSPPIPEPEGRNNASFLRRLQSPPRETLPSVTEPTVSTLESKDKKSSLSFANAMDAITGAFRSLASPQFRNNSPPKDDEPKSSSNIEQPISATFNYIANFLHERGISPTLGSKKSNTTENTAAKNNTTSTLIKPPTEDTHNSSGSNDKPINLSSTAEEVTDQKRMNSTNNPIMPSDSNFIKRDGSPKAHSDNRKKELQSPTEKYVIPKYHESFGTNRSYNRGMETKPESPCSVSTASEQTHRSPKKEIPNKATGSEVKRKNPEVSKLMASPVAKKVNLNDSILDTLESPISNPGMNNLGADPPGNTSVLTRMGEFP